MSEVKTVRTICFECHGACPCLVHVKDNKILRVEPLPGSGGIICNKGLSAGQIHDHPDRLKYPLRRKGPRGSDEWEEISWDEALNEIEAKIRGIQQNYGPQAFVIGQGTGRGWNHWHIRLDATLGNPGWGVAPTHVCLEPTLLSYMLTYGYFVGASDADIMRSNTIVLWGASPVSSFPGMTPVLLRCQSRGTKIVVVDPRFNDIASRSDLWIQLRPGTDAALILGLMNVIINEEMYDREFVEKWTYGFEQLRERVKEYPPERVAEITWVPKEKIIEMAHLLATNLPASTIASLGICMHVNAIQNGRALACLFAILGMVDAPGGILSERTWDVMLDEKITLTPPGASFLGFGAEDYPLLAQGAMTSQPAALWRAIVSGKPKPVKGLMLVANEAPICYENSKLVWDALTKLDYLVVKDYFITQAGSIADLVLPTAHWTEGLDADEEGLPDIIRTPQKSVDPPGDAWSNYKFFLELGKRFNPEQWPWKDEEEMWLWRMKEFYGLDLTWEEFVAKPQWDVRRRDESGKRIFKRYEKGLERPDGEVGFRTQTGRVEFWSEMAASFGYDPLPEYTEPPESPYSNPKLAEEFPLVLTSGRTNPFYHSAWTNIPLQRSLEPDPFVEIHPDTAKKLGILDGEWVFVESPRGRIQMRARLTKGIDPRIVWLPRAGWRDSCKELGLPGYGWNKANINMLIPSEPADIGFGTPAMRSTLCRIVKQEAR